MKFVFQKINLYVTFETIIISMSYYDIIIGVIKLFRV